MPPFPSMNDSIQRIVEVIKSDPAVQNVIAFHGRRMALPIRGNIFIALKPLNERKISAPDVINRFRPQVESGAGGFGVSAGVAGSAHRRTRQQLRSTSTRFNPIMLRI